VTLVGGEEGEGIVRGRFASYRMRFIVYLRTQVDIDFQAGESERRSLRIAY
jgi:hypothetical protein